MRFRHLLMVSGLCAYTPIGGAFVRVHVCAWLAGLVMQSEHVSLLLQLRHLVHFMRASPVRGQKCSMLSLQVAAGSVDQQPVLIGQDCSAVFRMVCLCKGSCR